MPTPRRLPLAALAVLAACSGGSSSPPATPPAGHPSVAYRTEALAAGAQCPAGGIQVLMGIDDNGNGTLDAAEVDSIQNVCHGQDGASSLARVTPEAPGTSCPAGGVQLQLGLDDDRDGVLDAGEVDSTSYVCNGTNGTGGTGGSTTGPLDTAVSAGPARTSTSREATFWFGGSGPVAAFRCRLDGSTPVACASPTTYSGLADGTHAFEVTALDAGGQGDVSPALYAWTIDSTPPEVTVTSAPPAHAATPAVTVAFAVSEPTARVACAVDQTPAVPCTSPFTTGTLSDGLHEVALVAVDAAGNVDPAPTRLAFEVDTRAPVTLLDVAPAGTIGPDAALAFHADEPATFRCSLDGAPAVACTSPWSLAGLADGSHQASVVAVDLAGTADPSPAVAPFTVDGRVPQTIVGSTPPAVSVSRVAIVAFAADLPGATFRCALDGGAPAACASPVTLTGLADGAHALVVAATSVAGLTDPSPATVAWVVDATPPETGLTAAPPEQTGATTATFQFVSTEAGATFRCSLDGAPFAACTSPAELSGLGQSMHVFRVAAEDAAGNVDPTPASHFWSVSQPVGLDTVVTGGPANPSRAAAASFYFSGQGAVAFECALDGAAPGPCTSPASVSGLADGPHAFAVTGLGPAGQRDATPAVVGWVVDTMPPVAWVAGPDINFGYVNTPTVTFLLESSEPGGSFLCALDDGPAAACPPTFTTPALEDGYHRFYVRAADPAGNISERVDPVSFAVDTVRPVLTKVFDYTISETGYGYLGVSSDEPGTYEFTLDGGDWSGWCQVSPYDAGAFECAGLPDGSHVLAAVAVDQAGNRSEPVTFTFTVDRAPTVLFSQQPPMRTTSSTAIFVYTTSKPATVTCHLDAAADAPCTSPLVYTGLAEGDHSLTMTLTSATGVQGFATAFWAVDRTPPDTWFQSLPPSPTKYPSASVYVEASEPGSTVTCTLDGVATPCGYYLDLIGLADGPHTITAAATDPAGNVDSTPATHTWTIDTVAPAAPTFSLAYLNGALVIDAAAASADDLVEAYVKTAASGTWQLSTGPYAAPWDIRVGDGYTGWGQIGPCQSYDVGVRACDAARNCTPAAAVQQVFTTPTGEGITVTGRDGVIQITGASGATGYTVEYGTAPGLYDGTDAAEGPSPVTIDGSGLVHGLAADAPHVFRVSARYGDTCTGSPSVEQVATPYPWHAVNVKPTAAALAAVDCAPDGVTCAAVGASGTVVGSAGASWTRRNGSGASSFTQVQLLDAAVGFALANGTEIFRSTDGGASWLRRGTVPGAVSRISFTSASAGLVAGPVGIWKTTDGGTTWSTALEGVWTDVFAFPGGLKAVAVGPAGATRTTADGGATWTLRLPAPGTLLAVDCPTATRCIGAGAGGLVVVSDDAGASWTGVPSGITADIRTLAFADVTHGWALDAAGVLHRTEDAGAHWTTETSAPAGMSAITAVSASGAWVVGQDGLLARTADGGATWSASSNGSRVAYGGGLVVLDATTVFAAGYSGHMRSVDSGETWDAIALPANLTAQPYSISAANADFLLGVGYDYSTYTSATLRSLDGGLTWAAIGSTIFSSSSSNDHFCLPDDPAGPPAPRCYMASSSDGVYVTSDGGASWSKVPVPGTYPMRVRFLDDARGFVCTSDGLLATADGGATWWVSSPQGCNDLEVAAPSTVLTGSQASFDAGATWASTEVYGWDVVLGAGLALHHGSQHYSVATLAPGLPGLRKQYFPAGASVTRVAILDADTWFALDSNGVIWKTTTGGR